MQAPRQLFQEYFKVRVVLRFDVDVTSVTMKLLVTGITPVDIGLPTAEGDSISRGEDIDKKDRLGS